MKKILLMTCQVVFLGSPAAVFHGIACCVALFYVWNIYEQALSFELRAMSKATRSSKLIADSFSAVQECDATKASFSFIRRVQKNFFNVSFINPLTA
ncbi:MAG TPA: hypothetical protein PL045_03285 [Chitinophagaceae bacterium]|nr:hypothetical protein [Chitinophagaceae bacterium]